MMKEIAVAVNEVISALLVLAVSDVVRYRARCEMKAEDVRRVAKLNVHGKLVFKGAWLVLEGSITLGNVRFAKERVAKNRVACIKEVLYTISKVLAKAKATGKVSYYEAVLLRVAAGCKKEQLIEEKKEAVPTIDEVIKAHSQEEEQRLTEDRAKAKEWSRVARGKRIVIYTSYFASKEVQALDGANYELISIASKARDGFEGRTIHALTPNYKCWEYKKAEDWANYAREYNEMLSKQMPTEIIRDIFRAHGDKKPVLLCWEGRNKPCHRYLVAAWLRKLGFVVVELGEGETHSPDYTPRREAKTKATAKAQAKATTALSNTQKEAPRGYKWVLVEGCSRTYVLERAENAKPEPGAEDRERKLGEFSENENDMSFDSRSYQVLNPFTADTDDPTYLTYVA